MSRVSASGVPSSVLKKGDMNVLTFYEPAGKREDGGDDDTKHERALSPVQVRQAAEEDEKTALRTVSR
jgi:hypothetical protein